MSVQLPLELSVGSWCNTAPPVGRQVRGIQRFRRLLPVWTYFSDVPPLELTTIINMLLKVELFRSISWLCFLNRLLIRWQLVWFYFILFYHCLCFLHNISCVLWSIFYILYILHSTFYFFYLFYLWKAACLPARSYFLHCWWLSTSSEHFLKN